MPGREGGKLRRRRSAGFWVTAVVFLEVLLRAAFETRWLDGHPFVRAVAITAAVAIAVVGGVKAIAEYRRKKRDRSEARATGRWPTGRAHSVGLEVHPYGARTQATLVFEPGGLRVDPAPDVVPDVMPFADIATVRVHSAWIEAETRLWTFRVVPVTYEDRQRLLWELALNCNAAMERGIDEAAGAERAQSAALKPAPVTSQADDLPRAAATESANLDGLDRGMSSLGSALAGPAQRPNPAPPRKSGLGNGLFVVPDGDA
jgi:hypothetical protein